MSKTYGFDLIKKSIDNQDLLIFKTPKIKNFAIMNHPILGTYSPTDSVNTENDIPENFHPIMNPVYINPTISMYTIIKKKPLCLKSLLNIQLQFYSGDHTKIENKIIYQGVIDKINILDLSIQCCSDECFDVILEFFKDNEVFYIAEETINFAAKCNNKYAVNKLLQENPALYQNIKDYLVKEKSKSRYIKQNEHEKDITFDEIYIKIKEGLLINGYLPEESEDESPKYIPEGPIKTYE